MCGIVGFAGRGDRSTLEGMTNSLRHRGPDGFGYYVDVSATQCPVYLGHRRLSILDIEHGHQPISSADGLVTLVYNGEIYNHQALRRYLESRGHVFSTHHADTEVVLYAYREWGEACVQKLDGMFAFCLHDKANNLLFLARDKFGEKPLYYAQTPQGFIFASEVGALASHSDVSFEIDRVGLQKYFAYGYVPSPGTIYRQIRKLKPGHYMTCRLDTLSVQQVLYWRFSLNPKTYNPAHEASLVDELDHLLSQAVERRAMSDVPLGVFLSGGIDSSCLVAYLRDYLGDNPLRTFTIGFDEPSYDESSYAQVIADLFKTDHHVKVFSLDAAQEMAGAILPVMSLPGHGEPIVDPSLLPTSMLASFAATHVKVALTGDGGDELFAGYDPFRALGMVDMYTRCIPGPLHRWIQGLVGLVKSSPHNMAWDYKLRRTLEGASFRHPGLWNPVWLSPLPPGIRHEFFDNPLPLEDLYQEAIEAWEATASDNLVDKTLDFYTNFYLPEDILVKTDRAAMYSSLETRAVLLDPDIVAFCEQLPHQYKYHVSWRGKLGGGTTKYLLKKVLQRRIPREILNRPKKGFGIPLLQLLHVMPCPLVAGEKMREMGINPSYVKTIFEQHGSHQQDHRLLLWAWHALLSHAKPKIQGG